MPLTGLLRLERPLIVLDFETTGTDVAADRIIEIGFIVHEPSEDKPSEWRSLINPGAPIPAEATAVHHITDDMMKGCRICGGYKDDLNAVFCTCEEFKPIPFFSQLTSRLALRFSECDFAGKNVRFDLQVASAEFARNSTEWGYRGACVIDADRLEQLGEPRDLSSLYRRRVGREPIDAHSALADVRMTAELIEAQLRLFDKLPRNLRLLHELQWPGWDFDAEGKVRRKDGDVVLSFGKYAWRPIRGVPPDYWRYVLKQGFGAEFKAIATEAIAGRYPR